MWDGEVFAEEGVEEGLAPEPGLIGGAGGYKDADAEGVDAPAPDEFCTPQPAISAEAINAMMTIPGVLFMLPPRLNEMRFAEPPSVRYNGRYEKNVTNRRPRPIGQHDVKVHGRMNRLIIMRLSQV